MRDAIKPTRNKVISLAEILFNLFFVFDIKLIFLISDLSLTFIIRCVLFFLVLPNLPEGLTPIFAIASTIIGSSNPLTLAFALRVFNTCKIFSAAFFYKSPLGKDYFREKASLSYF